jgi:membrane protease YdiL (CAAX protease family)
MRGFPRLWRFKDMALFGPDFKRAKREWLYPQETLQWPVRAVLCFVLLMILNGIFQIAGGVGTYMLLYQRGFQEFISGLQVGSPETFKAGIIGMLPSAIVMIICAVYLGKFGMARREGKLLLQLPKLGALGWFLIVAVFVVAMFAIFNGTFAILGIDPETYSPSGGLGDKSSASGLVEKTMAELAKDPILFALAFPGVIFAAPLTEEIIFRGALFSGIANSPLGRVGAVLITSAVWALAHKLSAPWLFVGVLFIMGLALGMLLLRFGSLWVTIACHTAWNTISSLAIFGLGSSS